MKKQTGFTIVELLIVIIVIAILAAISIVAYNGIQSRARDSARGDAFASLKQTLELYYIDNAKYPVISGCDGGGSCDADVLQPFLVPSYIDRIPNDPQHPTKFIRYISTADGAGYGIYVPNYETKTPCAYISPNGSSSWWGEVLKCL